MERKNIAVICDLIHPSLRGIFFCLKCYERLALPSHGFCQERVSRFLASLQTASIFLLRSFSPYGWLPFKA